MQPPVPQQRIEDIGSIIGGHDLSLQEQVSKLLALLATMVQLPVHEQIAADPTVSENPPQMAALGQTLEQAHIIAHLNDTFTREYELMSRERFAPIADLIYALASFPDEVALAQEARFLSDAVHTCRKVCADEGWGHPG